MLIVSNVQNVQFPKLLAVTKEQEDVGRPANNIVCVCYIIRPLLNMFVMA